MELRPGRRQLPPFVKRLVWWAEGQFKRLKPLPEGGTLDDAFSSYRRQTGKRHPEDLDGIEPPEALLYLYDWFWEVAQGRPIGPGGAILPLPSVEIVAWQQLAGVQLRGWELSALRGLDAAYIRVAGIKPEDL